MPADLLLDELHTVLEIALGWTYSHLYDFGDVWDLRSGSNASFLQTMTAPIRA